VRITGCQNDLNICDSYFLSKAKRPGLKPGICSFMVLGMAAGTHGGSWHSRRVGLGVAIPFRASPFPPFRL